MCCGLGRGLCPTQVDQGDGGRGGSLCPTLKFKKRGSCQQSKFTDSLLLPSASATVNKSLENQKFHHDLRAREREFCIGNSVYVQNFGKGPELLSGIITERCGPVSHNITLPDGHCLRRHVDHIRGRFHKKSQFETSFGLSLGLKSETFVSAEFLAEMDFTKGGSAETGLKS